MTTVFFDGQILAVDSMSTIRKATNCLCKKCGTNASSLNQFSNKLRQPKWEGKPVKYPGTDDTILAVTGSGDGYLIDAVVEGLSRGFPVKGTIAAVHTSKGSSHGGTLMDGCIIVATTRGVFTYDIKSNGKVTAEKITEAFGSGSGKAVAILAYHYLNQNAIGAVAMATVSDPSSGGAVNYIDLGEENPTIKRWNPTQEDIDELFKEIKNA